MDCADAVHVIKTAARCTFPETALIAKPSGNTNPQIVIAESDENNTRLIEPFDQVDMWSMPSGWMISTMSYTSLTGAIRVLWIMKLEDLENLHQLPVHRPAFPLLAQTRHPMDYQDRENNLWLLCEP